MENNTEKTRVGVGVMILRNGKVLMGRRVGSHGAGEYSFPGGHLEYMESFEACARRETLEECGLELTNIRFQYVANITEYAPKHYVQIGLIAEAPSGDPINLEPEKRLEWEWFDLDNLPSPIFKLSAQAIELYKTNGGNYSDNE